MRRKESGQVEVQEGNRRAMYRRRCDNAYMFIIIHCMTNVSVGSLCVAV